MMDAPTSCLGVGGRAHQQRKKIYNEWLDERDVRITSLVFHHLCLVPLGAQEYSFKKRLPGLMFLISCCT